MKMDKFAGLVVLAFGAIAFGLFIATVVILTYLISKGVMNLIE